MPEATTAQATPAPTATPTATDGGATATSSGTEAGKQISLLEAASAPSEAGASEKLSSPEKPAPLKELALPDGVAAEGYMVKQTQESVLKLANDAGLTAVQAQAVLKSRLDELAASDAEFEATHRQWEKELSELKLIQGFGATPKERLTVAADHVKRALKWAGAPGLGKLIADGGYGNHPAIVEFLVKVGMGLADDSVAGATRPAGNQLSPEAAERARLDKLYPSSKGA